MMNRLVSAEIEAYAQAHSMPESDLCRALREEMPRRMALSQVIIGPGSISRSAGHSCVSDSQGWDFGDQAAIMNLHRVTPVNKDRVHHL